MFPWLFVILVAFIGVCAFKEVGTSFSLGRLALEGKALYQAACPKILRGLVLKSSDRQVWCLDQQVGRPGAWVHRGRSGVWWWAWDPGLCGWAWCLGPQELAWKLRHGGHPSSWASLSLGHGSQPVACSCRGHEGPLESTGAGLEARAQGNVWRLEL